MTVVWQEGSRVPAGPLWIIALACLAFGAAAFLLLGHNPHFLGFVGIGVLVALGAVPRRDSAGSLPYG